MVEVSALLQNRSLPWLWMGLLGIALLVSVGFFVAFALPYIALDAGVLARFDGRTGWIFLHVFSGSVALFVGPFQVWMGITGKSLAVHRKLGMVYLASVAISSVTAFYLAATTEVNWVFGLGLAGLGTAWVVTTGLAYVAIRRRILLQHQEWMIRSYVVTLGFVFFRIIVGVTSTLEVGTLFDRLTAASWLCWALPLLLTEAVIQGRKVFASKGAGA